VEGQARLKAGRVLVIGAGGSDRRLRCIWRPRASVTMGPGRLRSRRSRPIFSVRSLYGTADVGRSKLDVAGARLRDVNPYVTSTCTASFRAENARDSSRLRRRARRHRQFQNALSRERRVRDGGRRTCTAACSDSRAGAVFARRAAVLSLSASRAAADWLIPIAPKRACLACCLASSARFKRPKRSSC
jgi:hypothetical protein